MTCPHRQAEPVVLSTGETVACVCVECLEPLPALYVDRQLEKAHRQAFCRHEYRFKVHDWTRPAAMFEQCQDCFAIDFEEAFS